MDEADETEEIIVEQVGGILEPKEEIEKKSLFPLEEPKKTNFEKTKEKIKNDPEKYEMKINDLQQDLIHIRESEELKCPSWMTRSRVVFDKEKKTFEKFYFHQCPYCFKGYGKWIQHSLICPAFRKIQKKTEEENFEFTCYRDGCKKKIKGKTKEQHKKECEPYLKKQQQKVLLKIKEELDNFVEEENHEYSIKKKKKFKHKKQKIDSDNLFGSESE